MDDDARQPPAPDPRLTPEQQAMVARASSRVPYIARSVRALVGGLSFDECESAGYEALTRAALRYDPSLGVPFLAFAYPRVRGAMIDAARSANPGSRRAARLARLAEAAEAAASAAAAPALAGDPRTLAERVAAAAAVVRQVTAAAMLTRVGDADLEAMSDPSDELPDERLIDEETRGRVRSAIDRCAPDDRALLEALYFGGQSMHGVAAKLGVNVSTVSRRHARALQRVAGMLGEGER
jgi:RNA polymerase sigma factor for flagellar operon FliA